MKTLIIALFLSLSSIISSTIEGKEFYKNVEVNTVENTITTFIYEGEKETNLVPYSKHILMFDDNGDAQEKVIYKWNSEKQEWTGAHKYEYYHNPSGEIDYLSYAKWNDSQNMWETDVQYTMYIYSTEGDLLTINQ